jgi:glycosyltransferase involved in cell wall biosynthesis
VAGVSTHVARDVEGVLERPAIVLRNGVDTAWWGEIEKRPRASVLGRVRLVAVQRLKSRKRGSALLDIVAAAQERLPASNGLELTFVGDGPRRDALERKAKELALQVRFLGACSREETRNALLDADCFIMASDRESFGLAAAEARAVGLPVLAYRSGSLPELVEDGVAGLLSDSDDEMVRSLVRLASEDGLIERLATESARTPPPCDWTSVIAEHERAYRDAIERSGNGTPARRAQGG